GLERDLQALGLTVIDQHNLQVAGPEGEPVRNDRVKYESQIAAVCLELRDRVVKSLGQGHLPLVLGGDHSMAIGTVAGVLAARGDCGVLWIDAHGDINTPETSPSGNVHGMPVAIILGLTGVFEQLGWKKCHVKPGRLVLFGIRNLDEGERETVRNAGVRVFTMSDIDKLGMKA